MDILKLSKRGKRSCPLKLSSPVKKQGTSGSNVSRTHGGIIKSFRPPAKTRPLGVEYEEFVDKNGQQYTSLRKLEVAKRKINKA